MKGGRNNMSIEKIRSSLNSDDLNTFNDIMYRIHLADDVDHDVIGFDDANNFIIRSKYNSKPNIGLVVIKNGDIATNICY